MQELFNINEITGTHEYFYQDFDIKFPCNYFINQKSASSNRKKNKSDNLKLLISFKGGFVSFCALIARIYANLPTLPV